MMTIEDAVKKFVNDFSFIPTDLIRKVYEKNPYDLECLNSERFIEENNEYFPAMYATMYSCKDWTDAEWIRRNIEVVEEIGFAVYDCEYCGILLGINGAGFDFYDSYWKELYLARGFKWHENNK